MIRVFILTNTYPFGSGEEFVEGELREWSKRENLDVTVLPLSKSGSCRPLPEGIKLDDVLCSSSVFGRYFSAASSVFSRLFLREIYFLAKERKLSSAALKSLFACLATSGRVRRQLSRFIQVQGSPDLVYSYWNEASSYGACRLKRAGLLKCIVSRAHGYDVYEDRRPEAYMPLKRQFIDDYDAVFALAPKAKKYLEENYNFNPKKVRVAPLGVDIPEKPQSPQKKELGFTILSLSNCVRLKRIDKIISAVALLAGQFPDTKWKWLHIGGGPLLAELQWQAHAVFADKKNVVYEFTGAVPHSAVQHFLTTYHFDVIVNASESEGMPVSLMEAMSAGVPAVAPDVGEISSLVFKDNGVLMSSLPDADEIKSAIAEICLGQKVLDRRCVACETIAESFSAQKNYKTLIDQIECVLGAVNDPR